MFINKTIFELFQLLFCTFLFKYVFSVKQYAKNIIILFIFLYIYTLPTNVLFLHDACL